ncbi:hypothetical protein Ae201684P_000732 [Aphanomyces euteiches]|uniref:Uncharacterized protein n=1 Tax=Aphanomyces euteiches TaxID=100861 RepID=A0A6G0XAL8_9STRA|nr:hypothetical protein Ae201684_006830 [Aphanomyces euteiches]KAH9087321.1 hypothetical protein Ae201684P_000732 [Aphanomyces euteiches]KAH9140304.1 hypothetical protein AeRB84_015441 [Aphanomyces euteiches]
MATWAVALAGSTGATDVWDDDPHEFMAQSESAAAKFDFYVFAYSWQAEFCHGKSYPGCANPEPYWETHFTIHGLWPDVEKGSHPGFCTSEAFNSNYAQRSASRCLSNTGPMSRIWDHEGKRHGTCSGLDQITYFKAAIQKIQEHSTPDFIVHNVGQLVSSNAVRNAFGGLKYAALQCNGDRLAEVYTCYNKGKKNRPTTRRPCPPSVLSGDTCKTSYWIWIPNFEVTPATLEELVHDKSCRSSTDILSHAL